jgi:hypothetical protein
MEDSSESYTIDSEQSDRRERFKRLAVSRTNVVLDKIRILSHCANKYAYEYADAEVEHMFATIEAELQRAKQKFFAEERTRFQLEEDA